MVFRIFGHIPLPHISIPRPSFLDDGVTHAVADAAHHGLDLGVDVFKDGLIEAATTMAGPQPQPVDPTPYDDGPHWDHSPFDGVGLTDPLAADLPFDVTHLAGADHVLPDDLPDAFPDAGLGDALA